MKQELKFHTLNVCVFLCGEIKPLFIVVRATLFLWTSHTTGFHDICLWHILVLRSHCTGPGQGQGQGTGLGQ